LEDEEEAEAEVPLLFPEFFLLFFCCPFEGVSPSLRGKPS